MNKFELLDAINKLEVNEEIDIRSNNGFGWMIKRVDIFYNDNLIAVGMPHTRPTIYDFDYAAVSNACVIDRIVEQMEKDENDFKEEPFDLEGCIIEEIGFNL
ncbi:hypothetical protein ACDN41_12530 [Priestia aryabhattai]|uniref:hypothetical protein n=1 Tax=Priestia aryabhattai TaxID=412384 RepID=UPI00353223AD